MLLSLAGLTKRFTGTLALDQVDFDVDAGEVHALLGENGAGKSTLIKVLAGVHKADSGTVSIHGEVVNPVADRHPVTFIHQDLGLVGSMTVAENIALVAGYPRNGGLIDWPGVRRQATAALDAVDARADPDALAHRLSAAERSIVAIARAMAVTSEILVLDEPTAALPEADVARLLDTLGHLRSAGVGIIYVTHRLDEVFRIADRVTVLRDGRRIATQRVADTTPSELVRAIVGRTLAEVSIRSPERATETVLSVRNVVAGNAGPVSFDVRAGEIVGLVGRRGAGHDTVGRAILGDLPIESGSALLSGEPLVGHDPGTAVRRGVGFVSSKRMEESLAPSMSLKENLYVNPRARGDGAFRFISQRREERACRTVLDRFGVRPPDPSRVIATLSGGNQQKVVVARWMEANTKLMVLEEPTFGVDVGSKAEIYAILNQALDGGLGVVLVSSDFEEVARICHRAIVLDRGRAVAEVAGDELTIAALTALSSGAAAA